MKKITNYLLFTLIGVLAFVTSCDNSDDPKPSAPAVTPPSGSITAVKVGESADISFTVNVPGGFKSAQTAALVGTSTIKTDMTAGATSGTIVIEYQAGTAAGADGVTLTVTDNENQTSSNTAPVQVTEDAAPPANVVLAGVIEEDSTLTADRIWILGGRVIIDEGATLIINPGTIIKGKTGSGIAASALIISRGAMIDAEGTEDNPIIFTSEIDNIKVGEKFGTNLEKEDNELWGGLIILGKAPISAGNGDTESSIEGIPADDPYGKYGGDVADDNSGTLKYVSVRHGGISIGDGNEINGITLGGVGSGTTIDMVEVFATLDDGIELFGGTVNITNAVIAWQGDDGVDIDQNYSGTVDNFVVTHGTVPGKTDEGLEVDGPEGTTHTDGLFTLKNGSLYNDGAEGSAADFKSKAQGNVENVKFSGYKDGSKIQIRTSFVDYCGDIKTDAWSHLTQASPTLVFTKTLFSAVKVYTSSLQSADENAPACDLKPDQQTDAEAKMTSDDTATGADESGFGWTAAKTAGLF